MTVPEPLMKDKRGLVIGIANDHSIAWGIARTLAAHGAELALTYQNETLAKRVRPLAEEAGAALVLPCDVEDVASVEAVFGELEKAWGALDFVVHAVAHSDKAELSGGYVDTSAANFARTLNISCYSFTRIARLARPLMAAAGGGSLLTLTYYGARRVMPNYNVMGVAKAALEASVKYLAADLGPDGIRVNAISAGPMRTLAGSAIGSARKIYNWSEKSAPLRRPVALQQVGDAALYLMSDLALAVTGEIHYVDMGYHVIGLPKALAEGG
jgi:enoyl-[acyl-carrier protein] reductase I